MALNAINGFSARIDGRDVRMEAGEAFKGSKREGERLLAMGLLAKAKPGKKEVANER